MSCKHRRLYVLSSPSGGGKSTIIKEVLARDSHLHYAISVTTRSPRCGEEDGKDYFFLDTQEFMKQIEDNAFLEWAIVHGHYYGTLREEVEQVLAKDEDVILDVDVQGGAAIKENMPEAALIFLIPPSLGVLEERLRKRKTENEEALIQRLEAAQKEMECAEMYDFLIINDILENAVKEILVIIKACRNHQSTPR